MGLKLWAFTMSHWNDAADAQAKGDGLFGLRSWHERVTRYLSPTHCFVACGTWSEPSLSPLPPSVPIINAGIQSDAPYDVHYNQLSLCAMTAAMAYALNHAKEWDLLALLDTDALIGAVDFDALIREFQQRTEIMLAQSWWDGIGGPLYVWKLIGAIRMQHHRLRANIIARPDDDKAPKPLLPEEEMAAIYRGLWWNPFPEFRTLRQDYGGIDPFKDNIAVLKWPFIRLPDPAIVEEYTRTQTALAKPLVV